MRITEARLLQMAGQLPQKAKADVGRLATRVATGVRVRYASDDPVAFADGARIGARLADLKGYKGTIARVKERLQATDSALETINNVLIRVTELAVAGASENTNNFRTQMVPEITQLRAAALAAANSRSEDGEYLLSSFTASVPPFDPAGAYIDGTGTRPVQVGTQLQIAATVPGSRLTDVAGGSDVKVFEVLDDIMVALAANDRAGVQSQLTRLQQAVKQVSGARGEVGGYMRGMDEAEDARAQLEANLSMAGARVVNSDSVTAASELARAEGALEAAGVAGKELVQMAAALRG